MSTLTAVERPPDLERPTCRRLGCEAPGVVTTVLCARRRTWELTHCEAHPDGAAIAYALGLVVVGTTHMNNVRL